MELEEEGRRWALLTSLRPGLTSLRAVLSLSGQGSTYSHHLSFPGQHQGSGASQAWSLKGQSQPGMSVSESVSASTLQGDSAAGGTESMW